MLLLRTLFCWLFAYFSTFFFFGYGLIRWFFDRSLSLQAHYHHGSRVWAKLLLWLTGIRVRVQNPEAIEAVIARGPFIVASNHQSVVDILVLLHVVPFQFAFFTKRTLFVIPVYGWYLWAAGYIPVNRQDPRSAYRSIEAAARKIDKGVSLVIFPEGSRSENGALGRFKSGFIRIAEKTEAPILPVAISGSHQIVPKGSVLMNPAEVTITVGSPIDVRAEMLNNRDERSRVVTEVRDNIATMLEEAAQ